MLLSDLLYVFAAIVALVIVVAPLGCWIALGRIEKLLKARLPEDGKRTDYNQAKQVQILQDIKDEGLPVDVRSVPKKATA